jgi:Spy/CpxP family protein refolding chaperone
MEKELMKITMKAFLCLIVLMFGIALRATEAQTNSASANKASVDVGKETAVKRDDGKAANIPPLSEEQKKSLKAIKIASEKKAAPVALRFAGIIRQVYENMLADNPDKELRAKLDAEMKETAWELLMIKGQSMFDAMAVLTPEQKRILKSEMMRPGALADMGELIEKTFNLADK